MEERKKIVEVAKNLFLDLDKNGKRRHSYRQISTLLSKKFGEEVHFDTIRGWANRYEWKALFQDVKNHGLEKVIKDSKEKEQTIEEARAADVAETYKMLKAKRDLSGWVMVYYLKDVAGKLKRNEIAPEDIPIQMRELEYIYRNSFEGIERLSGRAGGNKIDELMAKIDMME